ncbi:gametocyte-specific factor 1-like [Helicoverpa zea]|uniref:gametocyte-specific factor 1-like n=1 Tax=Helicoverpa zea TaxID=7113 RepID=UPI001F5619F2|nr:gametocyte-specific factor 1-like [Helicoverpa zea]XP_047022498.1 gametocyte-specific factor 1-like [Helicoverpa zea]
MMNDEDFVTCPYNKCHRVLKSRIQHHLIKCEKNGPKLQICPFNATHRYPDYLIKQHCLNCPSRLPKPDHSKPQSLSAGARTTPRPLLETEYSPENDPEFEYWD